MHYYQDTSNFRAPYDAWPMGGLGAVDTQGAPPPPAGTDVSPLLTKTPDGLFKFKPQVAATLIAKLVAYRAIFLTNTRVRIEPFSAEELAIAQGNPDAAEQLVEQSGARWLQKMVEDDYIVFASVALALGVVSFAPLELGAVKVTDTAAISAIVESGNIGMMAPVLADPRSFEDKKKVAEIVPSRAGLAPLVLGLVVAAIGLGAVWAWSRSRDESEITGRF